jgi:ubiquinone biosynthesis protein
MFRTLRNLSRLAGIALTLARYDALFPTAELRIAGPLASGMDFFVRLFRLKHDTSMLRPGERLAQAFTQLGPSFIKFGQSLATRADLIGEDIAADLSMLQDRLEPFGAQQAKDTIAAELGRPLEELFQSFQDDPVAAASIAQVHFAETADGDPVAVKVLRPGIEARFDRDLDLLGWLAEQVERTRPDLRRLKPVEVIQTFARVVAVEMDLRLEAAAASELGENFADDPSFNVPAVDWQRTARRVLTLERIEGIPIDERDQLIEAGIDPDEVLLTALLPRRPPPRKPIRRRRSCPPGGRFRDHGPVGPGDAVLSRRNAAGFPRWRLRARGRRPFSRRLRARRSVPRYVHAGLPLHW